MKKLWGLFKKQKKTRQYKFRLENGKVVVVTADSMEHALELFKAVYTESKFSID